jgi:predicted dehydrogenase
VDVAFSFDNRDANNIRNQAAMGGGGLRDIGVYVLGGARYATGLELKQMQARIEWQDGVDVYATLQAKLGEADYAAFTSIRMHPRQEITFHGDAGMLRLPVPFNARVFGEARHELQAAAFNRLVREGTPYPWLLEASRGTQAAMDAAFGSAG